MPQAHPAIARSSTEVQKKSGNFFSRHLGRRRKSSVSLPNGHPISPPQQSARKASVASSNHDPDSGRLHSPTTPRVVFEPVEDDSAQSRSNLTSRGSDISPLPMDSKLTSVNSLSPPGSPQPNLKTGGVRWAEGYSDDTASAATRPRRTSSTGTAGTRRGSIYVRGTDGHHIEGVDAGVGSKARKLSVAIGRMEVNECLLSEHFSMIQRASKKEIGEGGAAVVLLMQSKSAATTGNDKIFAVKEFRERDQTEEDEIEYVRKIKSEYAIAKSCSHPNIVETYRLCTADHEKKWLHVMQYCEAEGLRSASDLVGLALEESWLGVEDVVGEMEEESIEGVVEQFDELVLDENPVEEKQVKDGKTDGPRPRRTRARN